MDTIAVRVRIAVCSWHVSGCRPEIHSTRPRRNLETEFGSIPMFAPNHATAPKEETMVFRVVGDQFELTDTGTQKDGVAIAGKYASPVNGGVFKVLQTAPAEGESYVETMLEPGNRFLTQLKNGKQTQVQHLVLSKDGKTMSITTKGTDAKGKPFESVSVFHKQ